MRKSVMMSFAFAFSFTALANQNDLAKYDPNMAVTNVVVTNVVKWIEGRNLPIEGRVFNDVSHYYGRLPSNVTKKVNAGVRGMKNHTAGMQARFSTDSKKLLVKWSSYSSRLSMDHMPSTGVSGIDIYVRKPGGQWRYLKTGRISKWTNSNVGINFDDVPNEVLINFPLYNGVRSFMVGVDTKATVKPLPPRANGVSKPVVFYGTSITHGGCASRPGLSFVNIIGRKLDVPVVNLGFSGSGWMEYEMSEHLSRIDASCFVLDCLWNMRMNGVRGVANYEPFIRNLRAKRPEVPIIMAGYCDVYCGPTNPKEKAAYALYKKLIAEGWKNLYFLPGAGMLGTDGEGTVDGVHPNDIGMARMAEVYGNAVKKALRLK